MHTFAICRIYSRVRKLKLCPVLLSHLNWLAAAVAAADSTAWYFIHMNTPICIYAVEQLFSFCTNAALQLMRYCPFGKTRERQFQLRRLTRLSGLCVCVC